MLQELLIGLLNAPTEKDREKWFKALERHGMDRATARVLIQAITIEEGN